jgi:transmembrane sensor
MHFSNSPLTEVIAVIQNTYHMEIIISDSVKDCTITVDFQNQDLASVLKVLKSTLDLTIRKDGDKLYISGAGCR